MEDMIVITLAFAAIIGIIVLGVAWAKKIEKYDYEKHEESDEQ